MARCGCTSGCACTVVGSDSESVSTTVTGNGSPGTPYNVNSEVILLPDATGPLGADANALLADPDGLYVLPAAPTDGTCAWGFNGEVGFNVDASASAAVAISAPTGTQMGWLFVTATGASALPAGLWTIHGTIEITFAAAGTGDVTVSYVPTPIDAGADPERGGTIYGKGIAVAADEIVIPFSGVVLRDAVWNPQLTINNAVAQAIEGTIRYNAFGMACNYGTTATAGGG